MLMMREVDRAIPCAMRNPLERSEPFVNAALRAQGTHRAWNGAIHLIVIADAGKTTFCERLRMARWEVL